MSVSFDSVYVPPSTVRLESVSDSSCESGIAPVRSTVIETAAQVRQAAAHIDLAARRWH